ncbi:MAG TPA: TIGR03089 family protein [Candidatus Nanopelagicales bacterium]|nr:TIGR03089 family protein [Candidatus Nanopelagicales bacterium]
MPTARTIPDALLAALAVDAARPLITWIGGEGARSELSVRTFENNVAKAANLLQDEAGAADGARVVLRLPPHWQTAVWLAACAASGACAWLGGDDADPRVEAVVVGPPPDAATAAPLTLATSLHPLGMPAAQPLARGVLDAAVEVRAHSDRFTAYAPPSATTPWLVDDDWGWTHAEALDAMRDLASGFEVQDGGRILVRTLRDATDYRTAGALVALPLATEGSVVLLTTDEDADTVADRERCDAALDLDG